MADFLRVVSWLWSSLEFNVVLGIALAGIAIAAVIRSFRGFR